MPSKGADSGEKQGTEESVLSGKTEMCSNIIAHSISIVTSDDVKREYGLVDSPYDQRGNYVGAPGLFQGNGGEFVSANAEIGAFLESPEMQRITKLASSTLNTAACAISVLNRDQQRFYSRCGINCNSTEWRSSFCAWTVLSKGSILVVNNAKEDAVFSNNPMVLGPPYVRFYAGARVMFKGSTLGTLCLLDDQPKPEGLSVWQTEFLALMARTIGHELEKHMDANINPKLLAEVQKNREMSAFASIVDEMASMGLAVVKTEQEGGGNAVVKHVNRGWENIIGISREDSVGSYLKDILQSERQEDISGALKANRSEIVIAKCWCKEELKCLRLGFSPLNVGVQEAYDCFNRHFACSVIDLSEHGKRMEQAQKELAEAQKFAEAKNTFLTNISHAVRTPLNAIMTGSKLIHSRAHYSGEIEELVNIMTRAGHQLLSLINDVMEFSQVESHTIPLKFAWFDLYECIDICLEMIGQKANWKEIPLHYTVAEGLPRTLLNDETRVRQVLTNLVNNAVKFTTKGEVEVVVERGNGKRKIPDDLIAEKDEVEDFIELHFSVRDTGPGIPEEDRHRLFKSFSQVGTYSHAQSGTGLGLAISSRLTSQMGGNITLSSRVNHGSTFTFTIWAGVKGNSQWNKVAHKPVWILSKLPSFIRSMKCITKSCGLETQEQPRSLQQKLLKGTAKVHEASCIIIDKDTFEIEQGHNNVEEGRNEATNRLVTITESQRDHPPVLLFTFDSPCNLTGKMSIHTKPPTTKTLREALSRHFQEQTPESPSVRTTARREPSRSWKDVHVLVAEDNAVNRMVIDKMLQEIGFVSEHVENGEEALNAVSTSEEPYDVILMDLQMPVMDGILATKRIRAELPPERQPIIIAVTADVAQHVLPACQQAGMNCYVSKPVNKDFLDKLLIRACKWKTQGRSYSELISSLAWIEISGYRG